MPRELRILQGPGGDVANMAARNAINISQSSDESSVEAPNLEQLVQLACEQATKFPNEIRWLISLLLEKKTRKDDWAALVQRIKAIEKKQHEIYDFIRDFRNDEGLIDQSKDKDKTAELLSVTHFLCYRSGQVKDVKVDDWLDRDKLEMKTAPQPQTVYVIRTDRPPKDINDGYFWQEQQERSMKSNPSWSGFCDRKSNCQRMRKRVKVCMGDGNGEVCTDSVTTSRSPPMSRPHKTIFHCPECNYLAIMYFGSHSCSRKAKPVNYSTENDLSSEEEEEEDSDRSCSDDETPAQSPKTPRTPTTPEVNIERAKKLNNYLEQAVMTDIVSIDRESKRIIFDMWDFVNGSVLVIVPGDGTDKSCTCGRGIECWHSVRVFKDLQFDILGDDAELLSKPCLSGEDFRRVLDASESLRARHVSPVPALPENDKFYLEVAPSDRRKCRTCREPIELGKYCVYTMGFYWMRDRKQFAEEKPAYFCPDKKCFGQFKSGSTRRNLFAGNKIFTKDRLPLQFITTMRDEQGIIVQFF